MFPLRYEHHIHIKIKLSPEQAVVADRWFPVRYEYYLKQKTISVVLSPRANYTD
jgi:hypothetical protein